MNNIMVDIETLSTKSNAAILSLAAVYFDLETGEIGDQFNMVVDLESCLKAGLQIDGDTFYWWLSKSDEARKVISDNRNPLLKVLMSFKEFVSPDFHLWGNSARFDLVILENAYKACNIPKPWDHFKEMDVRTLVAFAPEIKKNYPDTGVKHNAIDDCIYQIGYCTAIWNKFKK